MRAGRLRHSVTIQQPSGSRDDHGQRATAWGNLATVWASINPISSRELIAVSQLQMDVTHKIILRYETMLASISHGWRIVFGTRAFDIQGVRNIDERNRTLELLCVEGLLYKDDVIVPLDVFSVDFSSDFA